MGRVDQSRSLDVEQRDHHKLKLITGCSVFNIVIRFALSKRQSCTCRQVARVLSKLYLECLCCYLSSDHDHSAHFAATSISFSLSCNSTIFQPPMLRRGIVTLGSTRALSPRGASVISHRALQNGLSVMSLRCK